MKINDVNRIGSVNPYRNNMPSGHPASLGGKGKAKDEVRISEEAMRLLETQDVVAPDPAREKQLEDLKDAVATGTYNIDAGKIANKLLPFLNN